ncbi:GIY-YIG nuclease family protein [Aestuariivivens sp. NBU2969]|uniref:GIY-YIG nuclease family protein n=1 Tax=Aestuariivivens sp. NBU2969 TaxID=2873267 RepID=UPI001CC13857|nr:GIY-YIG nuclease family protein [Aestuariivivens sp. NBU2969]
MKFAKTIKLFLIDGDPNGRMICELSNWTGKAYKIPRTKIKDCVDRDDLQNPGIYLLFGKNESGKDLVYIGEAEIVLKRLLQHLTQKDFWTEEISFTSKDENLNKAHIKYLENRLFSIANNINRYEIINNTTPNLPSISESDRAEMEEFLENIKMLVSTLGHRVFEEIRVVKSSKKRKEETFYIKAARGADASGEITSDGFLVHKKSKAALSTTPSMTENLIKIRNKLIDDGVLETVNGELFFPNDYVFSSASAAASIVMGRNANGLTEWKLKNGKSLKDFESSSS